MQRLLEIILGLEEGFLAREGELSLGFNPNWPGQEWVGAVSWNLLLGILGVALIWYVYRREGRSRGVKITLGILRGVLLGFLLVLLNRPVLTLGQSRTEPSVLAILIDDSISMRVRDAGADADGKSLPRIEAVKALLTDQEQAVLDRLAQEHQMRLYRFSGEPEPISTDAIVELQPDGQHTQVLASIRSVLSDLHGQRLAGVVVLTDGRETPARPIAESLTAIKDFGVKVYSIPVGADTPPTNIEIQTVSVQDSAFKGDIVNVRLTLRGSGLPGNHPVTVRLKEKESGRILAAPDSPAERVVVLPDDSPLEAELQFKAEEIGQLDFIVEAVPQPGEIDDEDNVRTAQIAVLDAQIALLYVDGYPRWEYRYLKNEMIRDPTIEVSCLLTSADPGFAQEGNRPIRRFPESIEEMMDYDVVIFGDVDPRQFSDAQLQLVADFVNRRAGGFGMIAGPRWSPHAYRNTVIETILPVAMIRNEMDTGVTITEGFRPTLTREGAASSIFRFLSDREENERFVAEQLQPLFWYSRGVVAKPGVAEVYAVHPSDTGPDGRAAPLLVLGRYGAGRTLFSAIDDSWRWRYYTGESIFDTYWVQQVRYLARSKKLGQRRISFTSLRPSYELGEQVRLHLRLLDPGLIQQLPEQIRVELLDAGGQVVRQETLMRQESQADLYVATFSADRVGNFAVRLPALAGQVDSQDLPLNVAVPRLELSQPQVDRTLLARLASETGGQVIELAQAGARLPELLPSAARVIPVETTRPLWDAPMALALFAIMITLEWVVRKMFGMV